MNAFASLVGRQPSSARPRLTSGRSAVGARWAVTGRPEAAPSVLCAEGRAVLRRSSASEKWLPARLARAVPAFFCPMHEVRRKPVRGAGEDR